MDELATWYSQHVQGSKSQGQAPATPPWSSSRRAAPPRTRTSFARIDERPTVEWCLDSDEEGEDPGLVFDLNHDNGDNGDSGYPSNRATAPSSLTHQPCDCSDRRDMTRSCPIPAAGPVRAPRLPSACVDGAQLRSWPPTDGSQLPAALLAMPSPSSGHLLGDSTRIAIQDDIILHLQQKLQEQEDLMLEREREVEFLRSLLGSRSSSLES